MAEQTPDINITLKIFTTNSGAKRSNNPTHADKQDTHENGL